MGESWSQVGPTWAQGSAHWLLSKIPKRHLPSANCTLSHGHPDNRALSNTGQPGAKQAPRTPSHAGLSASVQ